jgi:transcriptional regulator with GAF, ATPase, and Fis domain
MEVGRVMSDFDFFREAVLCITSSLDLSLSMRNTYAFFKQHFPVEAFSLHQYSRELRGLKLLFLVNDSGFHYVERLVPLPDDGMALMEQRERIPYSTVIRASGNENSVAVNIARVIHEYVPPLPRGHLPGILGMGEQIVGHILLVGNREACFTPEHEHRLRILLPVLSLVIANMLQFKRTMDFQARLDAEKGALQRENHLLRNSGLIGLNSGLKGVFAVLQHLAGQEIPVLIQGETGTGKELVADAVQQGSPRRKKIFLKVNCGAIPDTLIDSALFGFEKGAFTGAASGRAGFFEQADGGTLFLDEIGELPPQAQVRLLRVLQDGVVQRLGGSRPTRVDVRIIAATNRNLGQMLQDGTFREDLYYRLNVFPIHVPPLRERASDIPQLIRHFSVACAASRGIPTPDIEPSSLERLMLYSWPGNVRELANLVERALILEPRRRLDVARHLPRDAAWYLSPENGRSYLERLVDERVERRLAFPGDRISGSSVCPGCPSVRTGGPDEPAPEEDPHSLDTLDGAMARHIRKALELCRGRISGPRGAARLLGVNPSTLRKRMGKFGIRDGNGLSAAQDSPDGAQYVP